MHHQLEKDQRQQHHVGKILNLKSPKEKNPITDRPQRLRSLFNSPTSLIKTPPSGNIAQKMVKKGQKGTPHAGRALPAIQGKIPDRSTSSSLEKMKSRAALVLNQPSSLSSTVPSQMKPRMSIEAIVASLESEMRYQFGEDPPQLVVPIPVEAVTETSNTTRIAPRPLEAESMFTESATVEYIANISPIETPSSICTTAMSHTSPSAEECPSRGEEEDSAATSISDAMIDDEIADQPGLLMLGQSASVPSSPMRPYRSNLYDCRVPAMSLNSCHSLPTDDDENGAIEQLPESTSESSRPKFFRRRVASLSSGEINIRDKADVVGVKQPVVDDPTMRTELFSPWQETVVVDLEEYTSMANELADIKSKLVDLQTLLLDLPDQEHARLNNLTATPLWDLKRDIVLLREELQEKNMVIRTLKNELRVATGKTRERADSSSSSIASSSSSTSPNPRVKKASCSNVATQTDRPRVVAVGNGLSPGSDDIQVVSSKLKKTAPCGSGSGLCIPVLSRPFTAAPMNN